MANHALGTCERSSGGGGVVAEGLCHQVPFVPGIVLGYDFMPPVTSIYI